MASRLALLVVGAVTAPAAALAEQAPAAELEPYQMVRSLQLVQDRIAVGDHAALPIQRKLLEMIDKRLRTATAAELMQPRNLQSMMVYAMSGGNPQTLRDITHRMHVEERDGRLIAGILSYLNGATKTAALTLKDAEPMTQPIEIGAFLALIKGSVTALEDPASALKMLDEARLLSPGTLVEEAALRRSVSLATTLGDKTRFLRLSDQYVRSYLRSPYASQFADAFVNGILALHATIDLGEVDSIVSMMSAEQRKVIYLRVARRAAIDGHVTLSNYASQKADEIGGAEGENSDPRVLLYTALTNITTDPVEEIRDRIGRIDRNRLSSGDRKLLDAVMAVNTAIVQEPDAEPDIPVVEAAPSKSPAADSHANDAAAPPGTEAANTHDGSPSMQAPTASEKTVPSEAHAAEAPAAADHASTEQPAMASAAPAKAAAAVDPSEAMIASGRRKLAEIDELLAGAAE